MAFKKTEINKEEVKGFDSLEDAKVLFEDKTQDSDKRFEALEYMIDNHEIYYVLTILSEIFNENEVENNKYIDAAFIGFEEKARRKKDYEIMFKMLKSQNAHLRNAVIIFLQKHGKDAKEFIQKLMEDKDHDIRIFAINILGDVKFDDSVDMLRHFIVREENINALMTAVDYLGEVGNEEDIELLQAVASEKNDDYVTFGVDLAIKRIKGSEDD